MDHTNHTILVVEDDKGMRLQYKNWLDRAGYKSVLSDSYENAFDIIRSSAFDGAIIDIQLDEKDPENADGLRVVAQINKVDNKPQVILATGYMDKVSSAWRESVYGVWEKGNTRDSLLQKLEAALAKRDELTPAKIKNSLNTILGRMAKEGLHLEQVLQLILNEMVALIKAESANLAIVDGNKIRIKATTEKQVESDKPFEVQNSVSGLAIRRQQTVHFPDIENDEVASTLFKPALGEDKRRGSEFAVPVMINLEPIAVINFESRNKHAFKETDIKLIEELAGQVAIAINSARLQDQINTVKRLSEISSEINATIIKGENEVASIAVEKILEFLKCDKAALFNYDMDLSKIDFLAHKGLSEGYILSDLSLNSPRSLVVQTKESVVVPDLATDERFVSVRDIADKEGFKALLEMPLQIRGKMVGSISAYFSKIHDFESEELALAKIFADHIAVAIDNAQQYQELEEARQRVKLATIGEISGDIVHRMNSPLGAIKANVEFIRLDHKHIIDQSPELEDILNEIYKIADEAITMVRQLRDRARQSVLEPIEITEILDATINEIEIPSTITLHNKISNRKLPKVRANSNLSKVFRNLITNGIDAMPYPMLGTLTIDANINEEAGTVDLTFEDTGVGITDDFRDEIFNLLSVFSKKRADGGGHGLGLWYCRAFIEACGGTLPPPESQVGRGTKFTIQLPIME